MTSRLLYGLVSVLAGCGLSGSSLEPDIYRATLELPAGELPFLLDVAAGPSIFLVDGTERIPLGQLMQAEDGYAASLPNSAGDLRFRVRGTRLAGTLQLGGQNFDFAANRGAAHRFFSESSTDNADVSGRWVFDVTPESGAALGFVADLRQSHDLVNGALQTPDGSTILLAGQVRDDEVRLSRFDGQEAWLFIGTVVAEGDLAGEGWTSQAGSVTWRATYAPDAKIRQDAGDDAASSGFTLQRYL